MTCPCLGKEGNVHGILCFSCLIPLQTTANTTMRKMLSPPTDPTAINATLVLSKTLSIDNYEKNQTIYFSFFILKIKQYI